MKLSVTIAHLFISNICVKTKLAYRFGTRAIGSLTFMSTLLNPKNVLGLAGQIELLKCFCFNLNEINLLWHNKEILGLGVSLLLLVKSCWNLTELSRIILVYDQ